MENYATSYARKLAQEPVIKERKKQLNEEYMTDSHKLNAEGYQEVTITRNEIGCGAPGTRTKSDMS